VAAISFRVKKKVKWSMSVIWFLTSLWIPNHFAQRVYGPNSHMIVSTMMKLVIYTNCHWCRCQLELEMERTKGAIKWWVV
jgi:hypothetical protein